MIGILLNEREVKEIEYLIKRELDEILFDLTDERIGSTEKKAMEKRYKILFDLFRRVGTPCDCMKYIWQEKKRS